MDFDDFKLPASRIDMMAKFLGTSRDVATSIWLNDGWRAAKHFLGTVHAQGIREELKIARELKAGMARQQNRFRPS